MSDLKGSVLGINILLDIPVDTTTESGLVVPGVNIDNLVVTDMYGNKSNKAIDESLVVVAVGPDVKGVKVGDNVIINPYGTKPYLVGINDKKYFLCTPYEVLYVLAEGETGGIHVPKDKNQPKFID